VLRTPFYQFHVDHGAKFVDFHGWEMPIMYTSIHEEHHNVRNAGGLFDVSHMGRIKIGGRHARRFLERLLTRRVSDMKEMTCRYSLICNERGGTIDDVIVYRFSDHWLVVCNSSNREKVLAQMKTVAADLTVTIEDQTTSTAMVALQGPRVMEHVGKFSKEVPTLKRYAFTVKNILILKMIVSRTGYTGEDGVEVILPATMAGMALTLLVKEKVEEGTLAVTRPTGLGARDTLRTEAAMPLYGHELAEDIDPLSAGLTFAVSLDKDQDENGEKFVGQEALKKIAAEGPTRKLIGLKLDGKRTARQGMAVLSGNTQIGGVTSGCLSPTLGYPIAMAYVDAGRADASDVTIDLSGTRTAAQIVPLPFYKRAK
jgi:aminomethyltransferase